MKKFIKKLVPGQIMSIAQRIYWRYSDKLPNPEFSKEQYDSLTALKCLVSYNKYGGYCVPESSRHRPAAQKVLANNIYETQTIEFMRANCGEGDIVHAGTYFGDFLPALSDGCAENSKVWAFEPNPENYRCAKITMEINGISNVELRHAGLGAKRERLHIKTTDHDGRALGGASQIVPGTEAGSPGSEAIQIVTVDEVVGENRAVSIIQLDVEGHEKEALAGALETIRRCRPIIIVEVLPNSSLIGSDWFSQNILNLGYRKSTDIHGNSVFICDPGSQLQ